MAESSLEKLMRLKRERASEASAVGGADPSPPEQTSETPKIETPEPKEELKQEEPQKEMSAMERLRAIKLGNSSPKPESGVTKNVPSNEQRSSVDASSGIQPSNVGIKSEPVKELDPPKERKTHPLAMEMAELEDALNSEVPGMVNILSTIHKKLKADPECVTLLDDEEIGLIVAGLEKHTNVTIVSPNAVKAAKKASKVPVTAADL